MSKVVSVNYRGFNFVVEGEWAEYMSEYNYWLDGEGGYFEAYIIQTDAHVPLNKIPDMAKDDEFEILYLAETEVEKELIESI